MAGPFGGPRRVLSSRARAGLARILEHATFELLPLKSVAGQIAALPPGARVSVTASPGKGLEATIDLAVALEAAGFQAVPHLSARMVRDRAHLRSLLARMADGGIDRAFVVGGDATDPGDFPDGLSLLRALADVGAPLASIGIPCYPDGHAFISDEQLLAALRDKAPFADYMTTQLCFDPRAIEAWIRARRAEGLPLPVVLGRPRRHRAAPAADDQRADRRPRLEPIPVQERRLRLRGSSAPAASTAPMRCCAASPRWSPTRPRTSGASTSTRSTRSRRQRRGERRAIARLRPPSDQRHERALGVLRARQRLADRRRPVARNRRARPVWPGRARSCVAGGV